MEAEKESLPVLNQYYDPQVYSIPRKPRNFPEEQLEKPSWNFHNSIFKSFIRDT